MTGRGFIRVPALVATFAIALAAPATAQTTNATADGYGGAQNQVLGNFQNGGGQQDVVPGPAAPAPAGREAPTPRATTPIERGDAPPTPTVATGELPFTGLEAGLVALAGMALLGSGFAMRRASRSIA